MNVQDRLKKSHIAIMQHKTFCSFVSILACGKVKVNDDVATAATNGWDVVYNPSFVEQHMKSDPELRFLVLHEAMHTFQQSYTLTVPYSINAEIEFDAWLVQGIHH